MPKVPPKNHCYTFPPSEVTEHSLYIAKIPPKNHCYTIAKSQALHADARTKNTQIHRPEPQQSKKTTLPSSMLPMPVSGATCLLLEPGPPPSTFLSPFCHGAAAVPFLALLELLPLRNLMLVRSVPMDGWLLWKVKHEVISHEM